MTNSDGGQNTASIFTTQIVLGPGQRPVPVAREDHLKASVYRLQRDWFLHAVALGGVEAAGQSNHVTWHKRELQLLCHLS